jgi:hypothetical protein
MEIAASILVSRWMIAYLYFLCRLWYVTIPFIFGALFLACLVYAGVTNHEIRKLKKQVKELNSKVAELQTKVGISN